MSNYHRARVPGGIYFFTVNLAVRGSDLLIRHIDELRASYGAVMRGMAFETQAVVILPDHLHAIWRLPQGDADFSTRWKLIKGGFSKRVSLDPSRSYSKVRKGERGIWQRRFWEPCIRDEADWLAHMEYIRWNPVKHGLVEVPEEWPHMSVKQSAMP